MHKISIVPRGQALGYTLNLPEEDRYLMSKAELLDYMKMLLGGFVAEQIVFERVTTGAADDLRRVAEISRSMIEEYGMGSTAVRAPATAPTASSLGGDAQRARRRAAGADRRGAVVEARC